jgi:hypothetical protein
VTFWTSSVLGAGTGARVFFEAVGERGSTGVVYIDAVSTGVGCGCGRGGSGFGRGGVASVLFPRLPAVGELRQLRVGTDGGGPLALWHLRRAEVEHAPSGARWGFDCHAWIDRRCDFQRILSAVPLPCGAPGTRTAGALAAPASGGGGGTGEARTAGGFAAPGWSWGGVGV